MKSVSLVVAFAAAAALADSMPQPLRVWLEVAVKYDGDITGIAPESSSSLAALSTPGSSSSLTALSGIAPGISSMALSSTALASSSSLTAPSSTASVDDYADRSTLSTNSTSYTSALSRSSPTGGPIRGGDGSSNATSGSFPGPVVNDYPEKYQQHCGETDQWSLTACQCVSFVAWRISSRLGVDFSRGFDGETWSNANTWANAATDAGIAVNDTPAPGAIAQTTAGTYGHVAWVAAVHGEEIRVEEYNALKPLAYDTRMVPANDFQYIHFPVGSPQSVYHRGC